MEFPRFSEGTHGLRRIFYISFLSSTSLYSHSKSAHGTLYLRVCSRSCACVAHFFFPRGSALVLRACDGMCVYIVRCKRIFRWPGAQQVHFIAWDSRNGAALLSSPRSVWARWRRESASSMQATFCCLLCDARLLKAGLDIWIKAGSDSSRNDSGDGGTGTLHMQPGNQLTKSRGRSRRVRQTNHRRFRRLINSGERRTVLVTLLWSLSFQMMSTQPTPRDEPGFGCVNRNWNNK